MFKNQKFNLRPPALAVAAALIFLALERPQAATVLIPLEAKDTPAQDLVYKGKLIDRDQAANLRRQGLDISALNPVANDMWHDPLEAEGASIEKLSSDVTLRFPREADEIQFDSTLIGLGKETSFHRVEQGGQNFRLVLSTISHRVLMTRALLLKLGYRQDPIQRYSRLILRFKSKAEKLQFLDSVTLHTLKETKVWIRSETESTLELQDVLLEPGESSFQNYAWGALTTQFADGRRALRALLLPLSVTFIPENVDAAEWSPHRILSEHLLVSFPSLVSKQAPFDETAIEDLRWLGRRLGKLTSADWKAIVEEGQYPPTVAELVYHKLISRRTQFLKALTLSTPAIPFNAKLSNIHVKEGQLKKASFSGFASRFSYGEPQDPMRFEEMVDFGLMKGFSAGLLSLSGLINKHLNLLSKDQLALKNQQKMIEDFFKHILQHPDQPYERKLSTWGGPVGGFTLQANRQIATGTAYGSSAPIQLVDSLNVGASLGYFRGLNGLKNIYPGFEANISIQRSYMHLKSLTSISDAKKAPVKDLAIPGLLAEMAQLKNVDKLLEYLKDGEVFTITDSLTSGAGAQVTIPLQALMPSVPVGYNQNLSFGAGVKGVILKRTSLRRVNDVTTGDDFLQVSVQSVNSVTGSLHLDFNYFVRVLRLEGSTTLATAKSRVYVFQKEDAADENADKKKFSSAIQAGLREVLTSHSDAGLIKNYSFYQLNHSLHESNSQFSFLFFHSKKLQARHLLRIQPPAEGFAPQKYERSFYTHRTLHRSGLDFLSFLNDIVGGLSKGFVDIGSSGGNPAYTPYGSAHWVENTTDGELTQGSSFRPVSVMKEVWAGWKISKAELFEIFDELDQRLKALRNLGRRTSLVNRDQFAATRELEFYNVTLANIFNAKGIERVLGRLKGGDKKAFAALVDMYGGPAQYYRHCNDERSVHRNSQSPLPTSEYFNGNSYECLTEKFKEILSVLAKKPATADRMKFIEWQNEFTQALQGSMSWNRLFQALGKDGHFLQISVKGFRSGDHQATDSEKNDFISSYVSDSMGTIDLEAGSGALSALSEDTKISLYELGAQYLTGGD